jgi:hypothetical protein
LKIRPTEKHLHLSGIAIEFADTGSMYDIHNLNLQVHCTSPYTIDSSIPLTKVEMADPIQQKG